MQSAPRSASSSPCETDSLQCAWSSCPLSRETFEVEPQGPGKEVAGLGVAIALRSKLSDRNHPGWLPALFDERVAELTGVGSAIPSFPFVEMQSGPEQPPPQGAIHQLVTVLASRLHMSVPEIVMAYALVDWALGICPGILRCYSIRPMFLGSCIVTCKVTRDSNVQLSDLHCRLTDVFNLLEVRHLVLLEHQLLEVLHWRFPTGSVLQAYADAIFRTAGDELARRALGHALAHPTLVHPIPAPQVLVPWMLPVESPADRFRAAARFQRHARGMATRSGLAPRAPASTAIFACEPRAASHDAA